MELSDIVLVYENIYNQELDTRRHLDNKVQSYMAFLISNITLLAIQSKWIFSRINAEWTFTYLMMLCIFTFSLLLLFFQLFCYYKCFFRRKKNYLEMPVQEIREWHISIGRQKKKLGTYGIYSKMSIEDEALYAYMKDSYIYCAMVNRDVNNVRRDYFIRFENAVFIGFILAVFNYYFIYMGGGFKWVLS